MKKIYLLSALLFLVSCSGHVKNGAGKGTDLEERVTVVENDSNLTVTVDGGSFQMGSNDGYDREKPIHQVTLNSYCIGETEVTQELWETVMGSNPSEFEGSKRPVDNVSWNDCQQFIAKLNELTGKAFRLPTEAEWEFAARGGNKSNGYTYSGSNMVDAVAWYYSNCDNTTHNVATKDANELGIYDMSGNVYEWCQDWENPKYYSMSSEKNPTGPSSGSFRVCRGGSWYGDDATVCRVAYRCSEPPAQADSSIGLRLAL